MTDSDKYTVPLGLEDEDALDRNGVIEDSVDVSDPEAEYVMCCSDPSKRTMLS